jgi:FkbM family methyltransferase
VLIDGQSEFELGRLEGLVDRVLDPTLIERLAGSPGAWRMLISGTLPMAAPAAAVVPVAPSESVRLVEPADEIRPAAVDVSGPGDAGSVAYPQSPAVSYAQNREDVLLRRVFGDAPGGCYVDVGAGHPIVDSVTKAFSRRGWSGVNLEANLALCHQLEADRPNDLSLPVAVSNRHGIAVFRQGDDSCWGLSTLDAATADKAGERGYQLRATMVATVLLSDVLEAAGIDRYEFLKIDVEGHEREVLEGAALDRIPARVVVVEAVQPNSSIRTDHQWRHLLTEAGYVEAHFDGINCYFVQDSDVVARRQLSVPANVLDLIERP